MDCVHTSTAYHHLSLRPSLFTSETLVDLRLFDCVGIPSIDVAINFPVLKRLQLNNVVYDPEKSLSHLLSGCPVLEELSIARITFSVNSNNEPRSWIYTRKCNVSSPTLTRLVLDLEKVCLKLDTPQLRHLHLRLRQSMVSRDGSVLGSLIEADVNLNEDDIKGFFPDTYVLKEIVGLLYNVKCLTLSTRRIKFCPSLDLGVKFHNLTELKLSADWLFITNFLVNADNLRVLTIYRMVDQKSQWWVEPKPIPNCWRSHIDKTACLKSHLEKLNIVDFGWSNKQEFELISYILRNAKVLKTMEILYTEPFEDSNKKLEVFRKLSLFERGSKKCQLIFI